MSRIPRLTTLKTPRLALRPYRTGDVDALHRLWTDAEVRRYLWDGEIIPRETAAEFVISTISIARRTGVGMWTVLARAGGEVAGFCGFRPVEKETDVELVVGMAPTYRGLGLATEAARAAIDWCYEYLPADRILAGADPTNAPAVKVLDNLGFHKIRAPKAAPKERALFELKRGEWPPT